MPTKELLNIGNAKPNQRVVDTYTNETGVVLGSALETNAAAVRWDTGRVALVFFPTGRVALV